MARLSTLFGALGAPSRKTSRTPEASGADLRDQQRRQRMADAEVSLDELRADAAALAGRAPEPARPIHPGEVLWEAFMKPMGVKAPTTAKALGVPRTRIERLVAGQTAMSPDTALRLSRAFTSTTPLFWMNLQAAYDVDMAEHELAKTLTAIRPFKHRYTGAGA
jgi:addiction module HigA family antidote